MADSSALLKQGIQEALTGISMGRRTAAANRMDRNLSHSQASAKSLIHAYAVAEACTTLASHS